MQMQQQCLKTSDVQFKSNDAFTAKPISSKRKQDQVTHPAEPPAKRCLLASPGSLSFRLD